MDAALSSYVVRSVQKEFDTAWAAGGESAVPVFHDGQKYSPADHDECIAISVSGPRWKLSDALKHSGDVTVDVQVFVKLSADVHRADEIAGAAAAILHRRLIQIKNYPAASPAQVGAGFVRFFDAETIAAPVENAHSSGGSGEVPQRQITVSVDGRIELNQ